MIYGPPLQLQAATPAAGFALQDATSVITSWTTPADGKNHRFIVFASLDITVDQEGGLLNVFWFYPDGNEDDGPLASGTQTAGNNGVNYLSQVVGPGSVVSVRQSTPMTSGTAVLWAEIWGS